MCIWNSLRLVIWMSKDLGQLVNKFSIISKIKMFYVLVFISYMSANHFFEFLSIIRNKYYHIFQINYSLLHS